MERKDIRELYPENTELVWSSETDQIADKSYRRLYLLKDKAELTGRYLKDADVGIGNQMQTAGSAVVNFTLDRTGARIIRRVSSANLHKMMAIVLDNRVVSAAQIQSTLGANNQITGIGSMDRAKMIAIVLRVGALDAPIHVIEERRVGPSLGRDSINQGKLSALIGMGLVILFMIIYYKGAGLIADTALILNILLLMAVLAQFGFTLTLPGVAGIVLTIGMAVDANVLVFERIREELDTGKTVRAAIDAGYSRAFITILDANLTTLLTALVLYQFGTGPVRGFAVTLSIGILASMFTVLVVTRHIFSIITSRRTLTKLSI
ncbi:MAG: protein translocase subunit SecD [bacterium]